MAGQLTAVIAADAVSYNHDENMQGMWDPPHSTEVRI